MALIELRDVWEMYKIRFVSKGETAWENFWALRGISLSVEKGESLGIIGENGAGKSTLLKVMAGMLVPDRGAVVVSGRISGLLELGAGFQPELTGQENIVLSAGLFGLAPEEIQRRSPDIEEFASLGKFIHAPVKCYSQGMFVRLAFSIAVHMDPDIFLIDDTLAVGDASFQQKCLQKIFAIKKQGKTIIFVTHDMGLLGRLCARVVLLKEGRLVKDGSVDKVAPFGLQIAGERQGVRVLERGPLELVFNNGRVLFNWRGALLTPHSGAHVVFRSGDAWYSSHEAVWEASGNDAEKTVVATGRFPRLGVTQVWTLKLSADGVVTWDVVLESEDPALIQEGCVNLLLHQDYQEWSTAFERGVFPQIDAGSHQWESLLHGERPRACLGVGAGSSGNPALPPVIFEQTSPCVEAGAKILNADFLFGARVLQYKLPSSMRFSGKVTLDAASLDDFMARREEDFSLEAGPLKFVFDNGRAVFFWDGVCLTKNRHAWAGFKAEGRWWFSFAARWEVKKSGKDVLLMKGVWPGSPVAMIWEARMRGQSGFSLKISLLVDRATRLDQHRFEWMADSGYGGWFSDYGEGVFPEKFSEDTLDVSQRCIPDGAIGLSDLRGDRPAVVLRFDGTPDGFGKIMNADFYDKARLLRVEKVEAEDTPVFGPGPIPVFSITVGFEKGVVAKSHAGMDASLEKGKMRFEFRRGRGGLFWAGHELTKALGLYGSLRFNGRWHDSSTSALWKVVESAEDILKVEGKWRHPLLRQVWEFFLPREGILEVKARLETDVPLDMDRLQVNLMVAERYGAWACGPDNGAFPGFRADVSGDWDLIHSAPAGVSVGVLSMSPDGLLPRVVVSSLALGPGARLGIVNSDLYHRARVLRASRDEAFRLDPGEHLFFHGRISVEL